MVLSILPPVCEKVSELSEITAIDARLFELLTQQAMAHLVEGTHEVDTYVSTSYIVDL